MNISSASVSPAHSLYRTMDVKTPAFFDASGNNKNIQIMKLHQLFLLVLLAQLSLFACSNDDDDDVNQADLSLEGGWQLEDVNTNTAELVPIILAANEEAVTGIPDDALEEAILEIAGMIDDVDDCAKDDIYYFRPDGSIDDEDGPDDCDDELFELEDLFDDDDTWSLSGNTLIITDDDDDDTYEYTVRTLTETTLVLFTTEDVDEDDFGLDDLDFDAILELELTFRAR